jgi:hypothetical protein
MAEFYEKEFADHYEENYQKLVNYVVQNGEYSGTYGWYDITEDGDIGTYSTSFYRLTYDIDADRLTASYWSYLQDNMSSVVVSLKQSDDMWYSAQYKQNSEIVCEMKGYILSNTFTTNTLLGFYSLDGDERMRDLFSIEVCCILDWLIDYFIEHNIGLTIADSGFISYKN